MRTPWTLSDDDNWRKTHRPGSRLWFYGGLILLALTLALPESAQAVLSLGAG
ncbi:MAG: SdpI family protein [Bacteroidetes bacterium]|nr:SdpI family protein [Bacteroidota bacterium]